MKFSSIVFTLAAAVLASAASVPFAATITGVLTVNASVQATCSVAAATLTFSQYQPTLGAQTASTNISVTCNSGSAYDVGLSGTPAGRTLTGGVGGLDSLAYNLFQNAALTTLWGNTVGPGGDTVSGTGNGAAQLIQVFGRIPDTAPNQATSTGAYTDPVTITITY